MADMGKNQPTQPTAECSLRDAACIYAADWRKGRRFIALFWRTCIIGLHPDSLTLDEAQELQDVRDILEADLLVKLGSGEVVAYWHPSGRQSTQREDVSPSWWRGARLDIRQNRATAANGDTITGVTIAKAATSKGCPTKRVQNRRNYRAADAGLIAEMKRLITSGQMGGPTPAAWSLVGQAKGGGTDQSKVTRLVTLYNKQPSSAQG